MNLDTLLDLEEAFMALNMHFRLSSETFWLRFLIFGSLNESMSGGIIPFPYPVMVKPALIYMNKY